MKSMIILLGLQLILYAIRSSLMSRYYKAHKFKNQKSKVANLFSVIQPIVSGDECLEQSLRMNVRRNKELEFIWVVDDLDTKAIEIVQKVQSEEKAIISIIKAKEIPVNKNEKVWKQKLALSVGREYFIAMDDDAMIRFDFLDEIKQALDEKPCVITGLPFYRQGKNFLSNLVVGFVNGNSLQTYLVLAELDLCHSLNGMCYIGKTSLFEELNIFNKVEDKLSDEYEIAKVLKDNNIKIIQSTLPCSVGTTIYGITHYMSIMKRWMVFANIYMKEQRQLKSMITIAIPTALPLIVLVMSLILDIRFVLVSIMIQTILASCNYFIRQKYLKLEEPLFALIFEILAAYIQPIHYILSLIRPKTIIWRQNKITLHMDGSINYEHRGGE